MSEFQEQVQEMVKRGRLTQEQSDELAEFMDELVTKEVKQTTLEYFREFVSTLQNAAPKTHEYTFPVGAELRTKAVNIENSAMRKSPATDTEQENSFEFAAPPGATVDDESLKVYQKAKAYQAEHPDTEF